MRDSASLSPCGARSHDHPMKDLTKGSIAKHIVLMAGPITFGMITLIVYQLINLYFVTQIGAAATAGVNVAGNIDYVIAALTQILGVGTAALVAQAVGRADQADANMAFNQSLLLSLLCATVTALPLYGFIVLYLHAVAADAATIEAGKGYIHWALPGFALNFPWTVMSAALRGTGVVKPTVAIQTLTIVLNAILVPVLVAGWGTGLSMGVRGAGLANSISVLVGVLVLGVYSHRVQSYLSVKLALMRPSLKQWRRILKIGLPAGLDFVVVFLSAAVVYYAIRDFGAAAQAGFGIGTRIFQTILLPAAAIAAAAGPVAAQNFGSRNTERVKSTFRSAAFIGSAAMAAGTLLLQFQSDSLVAWFDADPATIAFAVLLLHVRSWGLPAHSLVYTCTSVFQGLGSTMPSLFVSATRFLVFAMPTLWLSAQPHFRIEQVWYLWVASVTMQALVSLWLLRLEIQRRLVPAALMQVQ